MEKLITLQTPAEINVLTEVLKDKDYIAFDTETTGVTAESHIIGFSVAFDVDSAYYIILAYWDVKEQKLVYYNDNKDASIALLQVLATKQLIAHNAVFDCWMIANNYGIHLINSVHTDTMILAHLLDENRPCGLKELGTMLFGEDAKKEQIEMKTSVQANGGTLTKDAYELYKADKNLIAKYGAKDTILTLKLFYHFVPQLFEQGLDKFFYEDESMPLLKGPTYELNTVGLRIDPVALDTLRKQLETDILEAKAYIYKEIQTVVADKYPGTSKKTSFNIGSSKQLAWLLFSRLGKEFNRLTDEGKEVCKALDLKLPYSFKAKKEFIHAVTARIGTTYLPSIRKDRKPVKAKKIKDFWNYLACGKETIQTVANEYTWAKTLLQHNKNLKLLNTYVTGIQTRAKYNVIRPSFLQHGTTSGRYSARNPNFQNLPRDDKRIKSCIIARPGCVFVGADYSQLEPRIFASVSNDPKLLKAFDGTTDFYSVIGMEVFNKKDALPIKEGSPDAFGIKYKKLRDIAKVVALSSTYGTTAPKMAPAIGKSIEDAQQVIDDYFYKFPAVKTMMETSHELAKTNGVVFNMFGRPRRMPDAMDISSIYGNKKHSDLPYEARNILNLAVNHRIQSSGASIMNRAAINFYARMQTLGFNKAKIVLQVHDSLVVECPKESADDVARALQAAMEGTTVLPNIRLEAIPKIGTSLGEV